MVDELSNSDLSILGFSGYGEENDSLATLETDNELLDAYSKVVTGVVKNVGPAAFNVSVKKSARPT